MEFKQYQFPEWASILSSIQCGYGLYQPVMHVRIVGSIESRPHSCKVNDIALIALSRSVDLTDKTIGFICFQMATLRYPALFPSDRADTVAIGWGRVKESALGRASKVLLQVELPILSPYIRLSDCTDQVYDPEKQFCAGFIQGGKDTYQCD
ncbi:unnamed protein product, partial [Rotaria magnacalcarata]